MDLGSRRKGFVDIFVAASFTLPLTFFLLELCGVFFADVRFSDAGLLFKKLHFVLKHFDLGAALLRFGDCVLLLLTLAGLLNEEIQLAAGTLVPCDHLA